MRALLCLMCMLLVPTACSAQDQAALGVFLTVWADQDGECKHQEMVNEFSQGLDRFGIAGNDRVILVEQDLTNSPVIRLQDIRIHRDKRFKVISTAGDNQTIEIVALEFYADELCAREALDAYYDSGEYTEMEIDIGEMPPSGPWAIVALPWGVQHHFANPNPNYEFIIGNWCYSMAFADDFGIEEDDPENTFVGWEVWPERHWACKEMKHILDCLGCGQYPFRGHQIDDALRGCEHSLVSLWGYEKNQIHLDYGCLNIATRFHEVGAFGNTFYWRTSYEDGSDHFVVLGHSPGGTDTLACVPADGGPGILRTYRVDVPGGYPLYSVEEVSTDGRRFSSDLIQRDEKPRDWDLIAANPLLLRSTETHRPSPLYEWVDGELIPFSAFKPSNPDSTDCADIVLYSSNPWFIEPVIDQAHSAFGENTKVRAFVGSTSAQDAKFVYGYVLCLNATFNGQCGGDCPRPFPVDPGPLLVIAGDQNPLIVGQLYFDDPYMRCTEGTCRSDGLMTDIDGDGVPDGPWTRIPADSLFEIQRACRAANDYNQGILVSGNLMTLAGGISSGDTTETPVEFLHRVQDAYHGIGFESLDMLYDAAIPSDQRHEAARAQVNDEGVGEIFGLGLETNHIVWPGHFFSGKFYDLGLLTTPQRLIALLPECHTGAVHENQTWGVPIAEKMMFNDPERTQLAGLVGHLVGGYDHQHDLFAEYLLEARTTAEPQTPLAMVAYRAIRECMDWHPWMKDYLKSVSVLGACVLVGANCGSVQQEQETPVELGMWVDGNPGSTPAIRFSIPRDGRVSLRIFDVTGRRVAESETYRSSGVHRERWNGRDTSGQHVSPGVYFARLEAAGQSKTTKLVIVR